MLVNKENEKEK
jgi:hypothetical protein